MKKKLLYFTSLLSIMLSGCNQITVISENSEPEQNYYIQEIAHLHLEDALDYLQTSENQNQNNIRAVWIPVMLYENWMLNKSETEFRENMKTAFQNCVDLGINTVYLHVRAYADAYYHSNIFPTGIYLTHNYDPLEIMLEEAHALNLSAHAWINPMRAQTTQQLANLDTNYILRQWYDNPETNGTYLVNYNDRYYLNPAYPEVRQLIADGITEILENYAVDGIHIDDYFYPTTDSNFDEKAFSESNATDLAEWRRSNCSELIKLLYQTIKNYNPYIPFSISPQGNFSINYDKLYADVKLWCSQEGYCDVIIPQIYYGFENQTCPFAETATLWAETATATDLVIGLGVYKTGMEDQWAGTGSTEWLTDSSVIAKQIEFVSNLDNANGVALYSYSSIFEPEQAVSALINAEKNHISELLLQEK
ncbi:MAG: family 10 glycosylhydrolase [Oscillospiraceae bacterium]|nr:family 10 glycosylhydrolase [Oscillospiraceae bacterium]